MSNVNNYNEKKFLDITGLRKLWQEIKSRFDNVDDRFDAVDGIIYNTANSDDIKNIFKQ